jgi:peptidyl-prolyl cis-trans isomerase B (cyclophilin B)
MPDNRKREQSKRLLEANLAARQAAAADRRRRTTIISVGVTVVLIGALIALIVGTTGGKKTPAAAGSTTPTATSTPSTPAATTSAAALPLGTCKFVKSGTAAKKVTVPADDASTKGTVTATVKTSQGTMTFLLDRSHAPCTVANFVSLAKQGYFTNTSCHRLTTSGIYVLQCGDPTGTGSGGPGYSFNDELTGTEKYTTGVLAMANAGANTNGSQFFIVYKDSTLGPSYTVFGKVGSGLAVVDKVAAKGANPTGDGKPKLPIKIESVTVS